MKYTISHLVGICIVCIVIVFTIIGPVVAPRDPRERNVVAKTTDGYRAPPFAIGTPGFILGSDQFGRDMLSRIIVGTQPTMLTIVVVATLRLVIGTCIGLMSCFAPSAIAGISQLLIRSSMYLPQLFGALLVLVLAGNNPTLGLFMVALTWSGWADVAQLVYQRSNEFVQLPVYEAARSSGATTQSILVRHIRRQLAPIWGMMWLREISNSLALLAMLGFLGYFVGGASWVIVAGDAVPIGARSADMPELGQLLATSYERVLQPQPMFIVGGYIALILLGFNLLGDIVRMRLSYLPQHTAFGAWQKFVFVSEWWVSRLPSWKFGVIAVACIVLPLTWYSIRSATPHAQHAPPAAQMIWQPDTPWRDTRGDASATLRGIAISAQPQLNQLPLPPAALISAALSTRTGEVVAYTDSPGIAVFSPTTQQWREYPLKFTPVGNPTLTSTDEIVVVGPQGFVAHYDTTGTQQRTYAVTTRAIATAGATISKNDYVYITVIDRIEAFDNLGNWIWASPKVTLFGAQQAQLSPDGSLIFLGGEAFDIIDGGRLPLFAAPSSTNFENPLLISGADGYVYQRLSHRLVQLSVDAFVPTPLSELSWNASQVTMFFPDQTGVTARGIGWMLYKGFGGIGRFVWLTSTQEAIQIAIDTSMQVMFVADDGQFMACDMRECISHVIGNPDPIWRVQLPEGSSQVLGASIGAQQDITITTPEFVITLTP